MQNETYITRERIRLFVDRNEFRWVVLDSEGRFWSIPSGDNPWDNVRSISLHHQRSSNLYQGITKPCWGFPAN